MTTLLAVLAIAAPSPAQEHGCTHSHTRREAIRGLRANMLHPFLTKRRGARSWHFVRCTRTKRSERVVRRELLRLKAWRRSYTGKWKLALARLPAYERAWAWRTAACESGRRWGIDSQYDGGMQFDPGTWSSAVRDFGGGYPAFAYQASKEHQMYVAIRWSWITCKKCTAGWPVCG